MADKGSIHVETINSENHMILDCSNVDICGNLEVQGDASFNSNVDISGNLEVQGDVSLNSNVDISGTFTCTDATVETLTTNNWLEVKGVGYFDYIRVNRIYSRARYNANNYMEIGLTSPLDNRFWTNYQGSRNIISSDDRLKHNEVDIVNALAVVRQLAPQRYDMTFDFKDADFSGELQEPYFHQAGFIAQEVKDIPELTFTVHVDPENDKHSLNYNSLFTYAVAGLKELDSIIQSQETRIASLEAENTLLKAENSLIKSKLNELLAEAGKATI